MKTFEELNNALKKFLKDNLPDNVKVEFGKYGDVALEAPAVYIYPKPDSAKSSLHGYLYFRQARINLFATGCDEDSFKAITNATLLAEKTEYLLINNEDFEINYDGIESPFNFDQFYGDNAVVSLEFNAPYRAYYQTE